MEHCGDHRRVCQGLCQAGLKVPKKIILLIQEFVSLGSVIHDRVNEKKGDLAAQGTPAPAP